MGKPPSDAMKSLIEKMRTDWLAEYDPLALKAMEDLEAAQEQLRTAQEAFDHLRQQAEDAIGELSDQVRGIVAARLEVGGWGVEEWLPDDGHGPRSPEDVLADYDYVSDDAAEVLAVMESIGKPRRCANPECNRRFVAAPWGREKQYCSDYCRVKAHRARQKAEADSAEEGG
jgi:hypothetical protein